MKKICFLTIMFITLFSLTGCKKEYNITAVAETGGSISYNEGTGNNYISDTVEKGKIIKLSATPFTGYSFDKWVCNSLDIYTTNNIELPIEESTVCSAKFIYLGTETNTITIEKEGNGKTYINGQEKNTIVLATGQTVYLNAEAETGYEFSKWQCDNDFTTNRITLTMNKNYNCKAIFSKIPEIISYDVSLTDTEGGKVYLNGTSTLSQKIKENDNAILLATPNEGYKFVKWVCGTDEYNESNLSIAITKTLSCSPTYEIKNDYSIIKIFQDSSLVKTDLIKTGLEYHYSISNSFDLNYYQIGDKKYYTTDVNFKITEKAYNIYLYSNNYNQVYLGDIENGSVTILEGSLSSSVGSKFILKPVSQPGYYFLKWETKYQKGLEFSVFTTFGYIYEGSIPSNVEYDAVTITPIFTNDSTQIVELDVDIDIENNVDFQLEYNTYYTKGSFNYSYYVNTGDKAMEYEASTTCEEGTVYYRDIKIGNYVRSLGAANLEQDVTNITLKFYDRSNKVLLNVLSKEKDEIHNNYYEICIKNEVCKVEVPYSTITYKDEVYYFTGFEDEEGHLMNKLEFENVFYKDTTIIATYEKGILSDDEKLVFYLENDEYTVALNTNDTNFYDYGDVVIPSTFKGVAVTSIAPYGFANVLNGINSLTVPESVINFGDHAFKNSNLKMITINGDKKNIDFSIFYCEPYYALQYSVTNKTLENMLQAEYSKLFSNTSNPITIDFVEQSHLGDGVQGHYEGGSNKLCVLDSGSLYDQITFITIVHEFRHYYQAVAIGQVTGLSLLDLKVKPTNNEIGAWAELEYTDSSTNFEMYYHNAREIDAREYATEVLGYYPPHDCE